MPLNPPNPPNPRNPPNQLPDYPITRFPDCSIEAPPCLW
jgi:hypothetical protein